MKRLLILLIALGLAGPAVGAEKSATFSVPGMTCALCPLTVKTAMSGVVGVKSVEAEFATKTAIAMFDDTTTNVDVIAAASANAGYPATLVNVQ